MKTWNFGNEKPASKGRVGLLLIGLLCLLAHAAYGTTPASVTIGWDQSQDTNVAGYAVYYGTAPGIYSTRVDVGTNAMAQITGLSDGATYYFVVTAYDADGVESVPSAMLSYIPNYTPPNPVTLKLKMGATSMSPVTLLFSGQANHSYEVQSSSDMQTWTTIWQCNALALDSVVEFQDSPSSGNFYEARFYRAVAH
jgi:hypothetical protein